MAAAFQFVVEKQKGTRVSVKFQSQTGVAQALDTVWD